MSIFYRNTNNILFHFPWKVRGRTKARKFFAIYNYRKVETKIMEAVMILYTLFTGVQCSLHQEVMAQLSMISIKTLKLRVYFVKYCYKINHHLSEQNERWSDCPYNLKNNRRGLAQVLQVHVVSQWRVGENKREKV